MLKLIEGSYASFFPREITQCFATERELFQDDWGGRSRSRTGMNGIRSTTQIRCISCPSTPIRNSIVDLCDCCRRQAQTCCAMCFRSCSATASSLKARRFGSFADLRRCRQRPAPARQERPQPRARRFARGHRRSRHHRGVDPDCRRVRRAVLPDHQGRGLRAADHRRAAPDGRTMSYAGLFDTGEGPLQAVRKPLGIKGSVLAPDAQELAFGPTGPLRDEPPKRTISTRTI